MKTLWSKLLQRTWFKLGIIFILLFGASSSLFYWLEPGLRAKKDFFLALWWSVVTVTTVGYGDIVPSTLAGKILGIVVMLTGIGFVSILTGNLASFLIEKRIQKRKGLAKVKLVNHLAILNWNEQGINIIKKSSLPTLIVAPLEEEHFEQIKTETEKEIYYLNGLAKRENFLKQANLQEAKTIIILLPEEEKDPDQEVLYTLLTARELAPQVPIFVEIKESKNKPHLLKAGADQVIVRSEATSLLLGQASFSPFIFSFFQKLLSASPNLLQLRPLTSEEKEFTWEELCNHNPQVIPVALCKEKASISLKDILDENSSLDKFIQELFNASGLEDRFDSLEPEVCLLPPRDTVLKNFDALIYLKNA